jgi:phosphoenolpyruvate-protein kinase (PTS system EI component)
MDENLVPLWVALGVSELSVVPSQVGKIKMLIRGLNRDKLIPKVEHIFELGSIEDAKKALRELR